MLSLLLEEPQVMGVFKDYMASIFFSLSLNCSCHSSIGRVGGAQYISIGWGCDHKGTVMHEMFHSLGRWHEHSRPDRNRHVKINGPNIRSGWYCCGSRR